MELFDYKNRVAVYLRKSRMDPDSESIDETLARHEDTLLKFAKRTALNIIKIYKEVVSGDGLFTRPQMLNLLQDIEQNKYTGILCMEIDRLGRSSQKDGGIILEAFQEHNVFIITPNKTYDLNNEIDEQSVEMQTFIARQELKSIKRRLRKGVEKTLENGCHVNEPPYGYRRIYIDKKPTLEICESEAQVIRMIFNMYVNEGKGGQAIANVLNELGYTPRKNDHFNRSTIGWYLKNPIYTGKIIWNKKHHIKKKTSLGKNQVILNPQEQWIISDGIHQPIISRELFDKAQEILKSKNASPVLPSGLQNPFAGLIFCKKCGSAMQRQYTKATDTNRLLCTKKGCTPSIRTEYIERYILDTLKNTLNHCKASAPSKQEIQDKTDALQKKIRKCEKEINILKHQKSKVHDLLERDIYDVTTFLERNNHLLERIQATEALLSEYNIKLSSMLSYPSIREAEATIKYLLNNYDKIPPAEKNTLYKKLIKRIWYSRTAQQGNNEFILEFEWNYRF